VFEVEKVQRASQQTFEQARETIRQTLVSQNQQKAIEAFQTDFRDKWRARTECRDGYVTPSCSNGPRPTPTPTPGAPG
jgi:foldase protein PrsA